MRIIYLGVTILLLFLSFLVGRFYDATGKSISNNTFKEQTNSKSSPVLSAKSDQRVHLWKEAFEISPDGRYKAETYMGNYADYYHYYQVFITDLTNNRMWRVYSGDFRTTDWKWTPDNKIKITYNCGTGCRATKVVGVDETVVLSESMEGVISESNGWEIEHFKSF